MFDEREHSPPRHSAADADGANVVCYTVYLPRLPSSSPSSCAPPAPDADRLPDARARAHAELAPLLETYFWHCEPFRLSVVENGGATVHDNDGEFLLIEAADALPSWVTPANTTNRVRPQAADNGTWPPDGLFLSPGFLVGDSLLIFRPFSRRQVFIHRGTLHLIPLSATPAMHSKSPNRTPNVAEAVEIVRSAATDTRAPPEVDRLALARARAYPGKIAESFHRAKCLLPQRIALLLREDPRLVTAAVHAFYTRDVDHMKVRRL
ncbi:MAG: SGT1 protein-domain-containing protein [Olpidium bornovanus]|uniref:SGT1 protein-domain-containing protein n=1 Tax=Olpidium bornovanus TaxID=278681 RepID=A0A8H7ZNP9_9FUNG|nr:MAG: SGT1 protein-domain-containing protein [Olpidium bornovanus]